MKHSLAILFLLIILSACGEAPPPNNAQVGAAGGAALGAATGAIIGSQSGHAGEGMAIGAGAGALVGGITGAATDAESDAEDKKALLIRQQKELQRQDREIQDIKRQEYYDNVYRQYNPKPRDYSGAGEE